MCNCIVECRYNDGGMQEGRGKTASRPLALLTIARRRSLSLPLGLQISLDRGPLDADDLFVLCMRKGTDLLSVLRAADAALLLRDVR